MASPLCFYLQAMPPEGVPDAANIPATRPDAQGRWSSNPVPGAWVGHRALAGISADVDDHRMATGTIVRVFCLDGPCRGLQFLDTATGRLIGQLGQVRYRIVENLQVGTDFGPCPAARLDLTRSA